MLKVACLWDVYVNSHHNGVIWLNGHIHVHLYVKYIQMLKNASDSIFMEHEMYLSEI